MDFSKYQIDIFNWIEKGEGSAVVTAVAGSGKTTTLVEAARRAKAGGLFLAFNKSIVGELAPRLMGTRFRVQTCHAAGLALLRQAPSGLKVDGFKYAKETRNWADRAVKALRLNKAGAKQSTEAAIRRLFDLSRATLTLADNDPMGLALSRGVDLSPELGGWLRANRVLPRLAEWGIDELEARGTIDFGDMVHLPSALDLWSPVNGWVFVDECQDLSAAQRSLVQRLLAPGGRVLFVGDRAQAIYGFAGADCASVDEIVHEFAAVELPLSICYRCPRTHLDLARELVPTIEARDGAAEGTVETINEGDLVGSVKPGDLVLCRLTAPLVAACMKMLTARIPAVVRGRSVVEQLLRFIGAAADHVSCDWDRVGEGLSAELEARLTTVRRLPEERQESAAQVAEDTFEACCALLEGWRGRGFDAWMADVEGLFTDEAEAGVVALSTVHRAKGLEADRVFILRPEKLPLGWKGQTPEQREQELNLRYVALTRAKVSLTFVRTAGGEE